MSLAPTNESELAEIVAATSEPLRIYGGATKRLLGQTCHGVELTTSGMSGVVTYEPSALTLIVKAGTKLAEIEQLLDENGQRLAFEPIDYCRLLGSLGEATIGGVVACNLSGPRRIQVGACRDFLLGVRFVAGHGKLIKSGGRVMKNVTGLDLTKLMAGSYGTLGVVTEVALKVMPRPETVADIVLHDLSDGDAIRALSQALGSPFGVSGAAHVPNRKLTPLRVEGTEASVKYRLAKLADLLAPMGKAEIRLDASKVSADWRDIRDAGEFAERSGNVWRISVRPSVGPELVEILRRQLPESTALYDWGGGMIWLLVPETQTAQDTVIRQGIANLGGGHATLVRANENARSTVAVFQPMSAGIAKISAGLRRRFDPREIFNRGIMN